jgi:hypothetical protein
LRSWFNSSTKKKKKKRKKEILEERKGGEGRINLTEKQQKKSE